MGKTHAPRPAPGIILILCLVGDYMHIYLDIACGHWELALTERKTNYGDEVKDRIVHNMNCFTPIISSSDDFPNMYASNEDSKTFAKCVHYADKYYTTHSEIQIF